MTDIDTSIEALKAEIKAGKSKPGKPPKKYISCWNCAHGELCFKDYSKQHCNIHDKSFESNYYCDDFKDKKDS